MVPRNAKSLAMGIVMKRQPSLSSLRLFMKIAEAGSFSEAARLINISQPALSRSIRLLEEDLEVRLFDRDTRNVRLTPSGAALLPIAERLSSDFDQALLEAQQTFSGQQGRVVVGALPSVAADFLPRLIRDFRETHPKVEVKVRDNLAEPLFDQLRERQIDFAVATPPKDERDFNYRHLFSEPCVLVCRGDDELAGKDSALNWNIFETRPFIGMTGGSSVRLMTDDAMAKADVSTKPLYECSQLATLGAFIEAGLGVSAVPLSAVKLLNLPNAAWRSLVDPVMQRSIGIAQLRGRSLSPSATTFAARIHEHLSEMTPKS